MTVKTIYPCVCIDHEKDAGDTCDYGMPKLYVAQSVKPNKQFWFAYCPKCTRGIPGKERKSAYLALKDWNERRFGRMEKENMEGNRWRVKMKESKN